MCQSWGLNGCIRLGDPPDDGFCTVECSPTGQPGNCDPSPGGTAQPFCVFDQTRYWCALDCSSGESCPSGMTCRGIVYSPTTYYVCM